jgi:hypothetical protein
MRGDRSPLVLGQVQRCPLQEPRRSGCLRIEGRHVQIKAAFASVSTSSRQLPVELRSLLATVIDSFEKLELAWHLAKRDRPVPETELQQRVQLDGTAFREAIDDLALAQVIVRNDDSIGLGPRAETPEFESLMQLYAEDRLAVISALMSISIDRIRSMAARSFADAFVLRKKR